MVGISILSQSVEPEANKHKPRRAGVRYEYLTCPDLLRWATNESLGIALIDPGKPWQNGMVESFNGKFRDECLSMEWFRSRVEAKVVIEDWRRLYNEVRPHSSLGKMTPKAYAGMIGNNLNQGATLKN